MWQHISFTLSATLDTYNRIHKNWVKFGTSYATVFLMLGFIMGAGVLIGLAFLLQSAWVDWESTDQYFYIWFNHTLRLDYRLLITSTGLLGAYIHMNPPEGKHRFETFSRSVPRAAWQLFILLAVTQSVVYYVHLSGDMTGYTQPYDTGKRQSYLTWLNDIIEIAGSLLPYPMAGLLYLKASGLKKIPLYKKEFLSLLVIGYAFNSLLGTFNFLLVKIIVTPLSILLNKSGIVILLSESVYIFLSIATVMVFGYIVHSAFREEEVLLDIQ